MNKIGDWYWPHGDNGAGGIKGIASSSWVEHQERQARHYARIPRNRNTVVCAGGHIGIMPRTYADYFHSVICFEPDPHNWEAMVANLQDTDDKVQCVQGALAHNWGRAELIHDYENSGASHLAASDAKFDPRNPHNVECMPLDHFKFRALDLLQLDIEGFEYYALQGAIESIRTHLPVIVLEHNACAKRYNHTGNEAARLLYDYGYEYSKRYSAGVSDHVYTHPDNI